MSELDEAKFKASYGVNAEVPEPTGKTAQAPGKSKKQGDASAPAQGSSDIETPGQSGTAIEVSEDEDQDEESFIDAQRISSGDIDISEDVAAMFAGVDLSEDFKSKVTDIFETALVSKVNEKLEQIAEAAQIELESAKEELSEQLSTKLDEYLDYVIEQWMEENKLAVDTGLKSQVVEEFLSGLRNLFLEHYIDIPEEKVDVVEELAARVEELESSLNEEITKNMHLKQQVGGFEREVAFSEMTEGLTQTQVAKLESLVEAIDYSDIDSFKSKIVTLRENYFPSQQVLTEQRYSLDDEPIDEEVTSKHVEPSMAGYVDAIARSIKK
jgi:hypothetical protein